MFAVHSVTIFLLLLALPTTASATEITVLTPDNYADWVPAGKEVDAIYGDFVLRNDHVVVVIAQADSLRHANMTVRGVAGCVIDCTTRSKPNDQLSAYYPLGRQYHFDDASQVHVVVDGQTKPLESPFEYSGTEIELHFIGRQVNGDHRAGLTYQLGNDDRGLKIITAITNPSNRANSVVFRDMIRADRTFKFGIHEQKLAWAYDDWFYQAYGILSDEPITRVEDRNVIFEFAVNGQSQIELPPGESTNVTRWLIPAGNLFELVPHADDAKSSLVDFELSLVDARGPVADAQVTLTRGDRSIFSRTDATGMVRGKLPPGEYQLVAESSARPRLETSMTLENPLRRTIEMQHCGYLSTGVVDESGRPIPFKVSIFGTEETSNPFFGPDSRAQFVQNAAYSANGKIEDLELAAGTYECVFSHGPEYDADIKRFEIKPNETTRVNAQLSRAVDTRGWVSAEYHSHSSPSGDNTSDQLGRVYNLLAEHLEFAPCTEHNRIDSYLPHLHALDATDKMATCSGMELTGGPLPVNHQNAFPLRWRPGTQDGGAPLTDSNPIVQIERLAMWDGGSEKLVQINHPNLMQILGDRDANGQADAGFPQMFKYTDVIEIHPLQTIFQRETTLPEPGTRGNVLFNWMQLLNQGYRIPGVVNTDAHYNFHGSGWLRNYIRSSTDEPAEIQVEEMVRNSSAGAILMTNGPFLTVTASGIRGDEKVSGTLGDEIRVDQPNVQLTIRVQCANWLDINRVQVFVNGMPLKQLNFVRRQQPSMFQSGVVKFDHTIDVKLDGDSHVLVVAAGEGLKLGRVVGPALADRMPVALSNPIYIDFGEDGFQPTRDQLGAPMTLPGKLSKPDPPNDN